MIFDLKIYLWLSQHTYTNTYMSARIIFKSRDRWRLKPRMAIAVRPRRFRLLEKGRQTAELKNCTCLFHLCVKCLMTGKHIVQLYGGVVVVWASAVT
jgi:hypothetical protein